MTRLTPGPDAPSATQSPRAPSALHNRRARRVGWVVAALLLAHVLAVWVLLAMARTAAAETEEKLAGLPWSFPRTTTPAVHTAAPVRTDSAPHHAERPAPAWLPPASNDTPAPWRTDSQGHITWTH